MAATFRFSTDGENEDGNKVLYSEYDLVVLDVFLGHKDGIQILKRLRRDLAHLPVFLWTTSRDEEIVAETSLANGVLLKKTTTVGDICSAVKQWAPQGRALRTAILPSPFFNYAIREPRHRRLAVECYEWCLKQLDSFHALDGEYFRRFTDHGGRHIVKLLELLGSALEPFLDDPDQEVLLPEDKDSREIEILALYLAVVFHELGMFPMKIDGTIEDFMTVNEVYQANYLNDVRSLHAARGMVLIEDTTGVGSCGIGRYWNDDHGARVGAKLRACGGSRLLAERLAVLVGYHARLFPSLQKEAFLSLESNGEDFVSARAGLRRKINKLEVIRPSLSVHDETERAGEVIEGAFERLGVSLNDLPTRERLRRQCAVFRFVDALDVTESRNAAGFLLEYLKVPSMQHRENFKRELCVSASIRGGHARVELIAPEPTVDQVRVAISMIEPGDLDSDIDRFLSREGAADRIAMPWSFSLDGLGINEGLALLRNETVMVVQKALDRWLDNVWAVVYKTDKPAPGFQDKMRIKGMLVCDEDAPTLNNRGEEFVAAMAGVSIAGELIEEYLGIVEGELVDRVQLCEFVFDRDNDLRSRRAALPTLSAYVRKRP